MKKAFILFSFLLLFLSCSSIQNGNKLVDLDGKSKKIDRSKSTIYVLFSTVGCHDCHESLNEYFEKNKLYSIDSIEIIGYIAIEKDNLNSKLSRKSYLLSFKNYYPKINKVFFSEEDANKNINLLNQKIPNYEVPAIFSIKGDSSRFVNIRNIFQIENGRNVVNNELKSIILF